MSLADEVWASIATFVGSCDRCAGRKDVDVNPTPYYLSCSSVEDVRVVFVARNPGTLIARNNEEDVVKAYKELTGDTPTEFRMRVKNSTFEGSLMHQYLEALNIDNYVFLNIVKCATKGNVTPSPVVRKNCAGWLTNQLDLLVNRTNFQALVSFGWDAARAIDPKLDSDVSLMKPKVFKKLNYVWVASQHPASYGYRKEAEMLYVGAAIDKAFEMAGALAW